MALKFNCPNCGCERVVWFLKIGDVARCPSCGTEVPVPSDAVEIEVESKNINSPAVKRSYDTRNEVKSTNSNLVGGIIVMVIGIVLIIIANTVSFTYRVIREVDAGILGTISMPDYEYNATLHDLVLYGGIGLVILGGILLALGLGSVQSKPEPVIQRKPQFCSSCGSKLTAEDDFCPNCGAKIS
ncbi:MAG: zinc-ribbon domain-containing protein [candidate division WOR-3 bacterium]